MPVQTPQWMDVLCCCICFNGFDNNHYQPVSLVCCHTACRACLLKLKTKQCPFDQSAINIPVAELPINSRILKILDVSPSDDLSKIRRLFEKGDVTYYIDSVAVLESLCIYLKRAPSDRGGTIYSEKLSRPMQRKLINLICCNLVEPEGRARALKSIRSLGERCLTELLLLHQNPYHLSSNLWATVRARGCQFLGPAMQEEVLKLVLLALSEGALISRKVLVMYIVQTLEKEYPHASKTSVGHVVQLLYRASCFNVIKRDAESSLMQLKEEFRSYDALRREHDAQIVQIAMEAGLRISPDQWSALLYGDQAHKSHMQSIIDKLQSPQSFSQCIQELLISLQRTGDPGHLVDLRPYFENLAEIDVTHGDNNIPSWQQLLNAINGIKVVIDGQVKFCDNYGGPRAQRETTEHNVVAYKFKTSMCRDIGEGKSCMRGETCTFAHSIEEMERYRARSRLMGYKSKTGQNRSRPSSSSHAPESTLMHDGEFYDMTNESGDLNSSFGSVADYWHAPFEMSVPNAFLLQQPPTLLNRCPIPQADAASSPVTVITNAGIEQVMQAPVIPAAVSPVTAAGPVIATASPNLTNQFPIENGQIATISAIPYQMIQGPAALPPYNPLMPPSAASPPIPVNTALPPPQPPDVPFFWAGVPGKLMQVELASIPAGMVPLGQSELSTFNKYFNQAAAVQSMPPPPTCVGAYIAYPPSGMPLHFEEFPPPQRTGALRDGFLTSFEQYRWDSSRDQAISGSTMQSNGKASPVSNDSLPNEMKKLTENEGVSESDKDKNSKLQLLGKKREEILSRLSALKRSTSHEDSYDESEEDRTTKDFVHRIVTSVLPEDFSSDQPHHRLKCTMSCGDELLNRVSSEPTTFLHASMKRSQISEGASYKEPAIAIPIVSAPMPLRNDVKRNSSLRRSLSTEDDEKRKDLDTATSVNYDPYSTWAAVRSPPIDQNPSITSLWRHSSANMAATESRREVIANHSTQSLKTDFVRSSGLTQNPSQMIVSQATKLFAQSRLPFLPEDCSDIRRLTAEALRRQLENSPANSRRAYYIRMELEARDAEYWRSDDDQVIPFSGGMQVSRYGPISRNRAVMTAGIDLTSAKPVPVTSSLNSDVLQVKDTYRHPLTTAMVQPPKEQPMASRESVDPSTIVNSIPIVFQASAPTMNPTAVGEKIEKAVEISEMLDLQVVTTEVTSSVEREQLRMDLQMIRNEISTLDDVTGEQCLLKELENVNQNIKQLSI